MSRLVWDQTGEKFYEAGVDRAVVYPMSTTGAYTAGAAWNGLTAVNESPEGAEPSPLYANNRKYVEIMSSEEFKGTIEAYTYPDEFEPCNGVVKIAEGVYATQQNRTRFGLTYRTGIGNDTQGMKAGYKIHLVYNCLASVAEKENPTIGEEVEPTTLSWEFSTTKVDCGTFEPTAHLIVDSTKVDAEKLAQLEDMLYGKDGAEGEGTDPKLPTPEEFIALFGGEAA